MDPYVKQNPSVCRSAKMEAYARKEPKETTPAIVQRVATKDLLVMTFRNVLQNVKWEVCVRKLETATAATVRVQDLRGPRAGIRIFLMILRVETENFIICIIW